MKQRLFLAIELPDNVAKSVLQLQTQLDRLHLPIDWEPEEKLHLTLNFLGKVDDSLLSEISLIVRNRCSETQNFKLIPAFLETLYKRHETSIVYLGLGGDVTELKNLQKDLASAFSQLQFSQSERFLPHITIGKVKKNDPVVTKSVLDTINQQEFTPLPEFAVDHLTLFRSFPAKFDSHYQRVGRFPIQ